MLHYFRQLLDSDTLSPHGICLLWRPELIWTHVLSDLVIGIAYMSIPLALTYFVSKRRDVSFGWVLWCFVAFILACGTTHFLSIVTLWWPIYGIEGLVKAATALVSIATAAALWPLIPKVLALPSPTQLRRANEELTARVAERDHALAALKAETLERERAEEMLRQSQKMEAIGQLTGSVAHDFNNLLGIVVGNLESMERRLPDDDRLHKALRNAMSGAERAAAITSQLLAFARKQPLRPRDLQVNDLLMELSPLLRGAVGSHVDFTMDLGSDLHAVRIDPSGFENAVINLLVNARDALTAESANDVTITTRNISAEEHSNADGSEPGTECILIEVSDTGTGMSEDVLSKAFEPFFSTKPVGHGTGLGLSQVFGFAKQSGGHVVIDSKIGRGTKVRLILPKACLGEQQVSEPVLLDRAS